MFNKKKNSSILLYAILFSICSVMMFAGTWEIEYESKNEGYGLVQEYLKGFPFPFQTVENTHGADWQGNSGEAPFSAIYWGINLALHFVLWVIIIVSVKQVSKMLNYKKKYSATALLVCDVSLILITLLMIFKTFILWQFRMDWFFYDYKVLNFNLF